MRNSYHIFTILLYLFLRSTITLAQPANDNCINALDITDAFTGICGDFNTIGPFDNTGAAPGNSDPMVPDCFSDAEAMQRSIWFKFTVPDINGDGSNVTYEINTSVNESCNFVNGPVSGSADTQMVIYTAAFGCPTPLWVSSNYVGCNDDINPIPPYLAGLNVSLKPGDSYYIVIDTFNGSVGEFCFDILLCGKVCGDGRCSSSENFCACNQDCTCDILRPRFSCILNDGQFVNCGTSPTEGFVFCESTFENANPESIYIGFNVGSVNDCNQVKPTSADVFYDNGILLNSNLESIVSGSLVPVDEVYFFEVKPEDITQNAEIAVIVSTELSNGLVCSNNFDIKVAEILATTTVNCGTCAAGNIDLDLADQTVSVGSNIRVCTNGLENLNVFCDSNDNSNFEYRWLVYTDLNNDGNFNTAITPPLEVDACNLLPTSFLIDWFNVFNNGTNVQVPTGAYKICGLALCSDNDGTVVNVCETKDCISLNLTNEIPGCTDTTACNYNETATQNDGTCIFDGDNCNDNNPQTINDVITNCECIGETTTTIIEGCTSICYIEYNPQATIDDGTCITPFTGCSNQNAVNYNPNLNIECSDSTLCIFSDGDGDTLPDYLEDVNGNGDLTDDDTDQDGLANFLDPDDDGDNILTKNEDANGNGNLFDDDSDGDGIVDFLDAELVNIKNYNLHKIKVWPNPNKGIFRLNVKHISNPQNLQIINAAGKKMNYKLVAGFIKITNAKKGIYLGYFEKERAVFKILVE